MHCLLLLCFTAASAQISTGVDWELENFKQHLQQLFEKSEIYISRVENIIKDKEQGSKDFLNNISESDVFTDNREFSPLDPCRKHLINKKNIDSIFLEGLSYTREPLKQRISGLRQQLADVNKTLYLLHDRSEVKLLTCKFEGKDCANETKQWLTKQLSVLKHLLTRNSNAHSLKKRSYIYCSNHYGSTISIQDSQKCDGNCECRDCEDEEDCTDCTDKFRCKKKGCIEKIQECDGNNDCGDYSDEQNCTISSKCTIKNDRYLCKNKNCILLIQTCDGYDDCEDGSDEGGQCNNLVCPQACTRLNGVCLPLPETPACLSECPIGRIQNNNVCNSIISPNSTSVTELLNDLSILVEQWQVDYNRLVLKTKRKLIKAKINIGTCKGGYWSRNIQYNLTVTDPPVTTEHADIISEDIIITK